MIDAYQIGAGIILDDDILGQVGKLYDKFSAVAGIIDRINTALGQTASLTAAAIGPASGLADQYERAAMAAERIRTAGGGFYGGGGSNFTMPGYGDAPPPLMLGGPDPRPTLNPGDPARTPYGLPGFSGHDVYSAMFAGGLAFGGITAAATSMATNVEAIDKPRALLIGQGVPASVADQMVSVARGIQQNQPGVSFAGALQMIYDTYTVTKNAQESIAAAPALAQDMFALHEIGDDSGGGDLYDMVKAMEIKGTLTTKNPDGTVNINPLLDAVNLATQVSIATGGKLQPADAFRIAQNAGPIWKSLDPDAYVEALLLSNELGPSRVGTGLQGFGRQLIGGKMSKQQAEMFASLGLLNIKDFHPGAMGYGYVTSGGFKDQDEIAKNPFQWINDELVPKLLKENPQDQEATIRGVSQMFSTVPGQRLAITDILSQMVLDRQMNAVFSLPPIATTDAGYRKNDPGVALTGFGQAFDAFANALGSPLTTAAVAGLHALTGGLNDLDNYFVKHPIRADVVDAGLFGGIAAAGYGLFKMLTGKFLGGAKKAAEEAARGGDAGFFEGEGEAAAAGGAAGAETGPGALIAAFAAAVGYAIWGGEGKISDALANGTARVIDGRIIRVQVMNPQDLADGMVSKLADHQGGMPTGPTSLNTNIVPPAPGMPIPGKLSP